MDKKPKNIGKGKHRTRAQAGNAIVMLFAAIGMAGVVTYGLNNVIRGPAVTTAEVSRRTIAENNLVATTRLAISSAARQQTNGGDCDGDGFVEPLPYRDAGVGPHPAGGGYIPSTMGASMADPWGNQYGYCVWDPGTVSVADAMPACGGATPRRLQGAPRDDQYAIAVVSAGRNGVFETQCRDYADLDTDNVPDDIMLETDAGSDDIVLAYSYAEANGIGGGEWRLKDGTPGTAEIGKNIALGSTSNPRGAAFTEGLELGGARGLILPRDPGDDTVTGACDDSKVNQLRLNIGDGSEIPLLEICFEDAWTVVSGGTDMGGGSCDSLGPWTGMSIGSSWGHYHDVIYAGGQYVAVSQHSDIVATSPDAITWTERSVPAGDWMDITYGNGLFVATATGGTNRIITSPDGITWTARTPVENSRINDVAFGNGVFIAVAEDGTDRVMRSADGITWTASTPSEVAPWYSVQFMNGQFVAGAGGGGAGDDLMTSPDGINWTSVANDGEWFGRMAYNGSGTYVYGGSEFIVVSTDGGLATWVSNPAPAGMDGLTAAAYGGGQFVVTGWGGNPDVATSTDGISWTTMPSPDAIWVGATYGDNKFVITGFNGEGMYAECIGSGTPAPSSACALGPWIDRNATTPDGLSSRDVVFANGIFVSAGESNAVMTSPDGITWTQRGGAAGGEWNGVAFGANTWVVVGGGTPSVMTSTDNGVTWTARTVPENNSWRDVVYANGYFVAVADTGTNRVMRSTDGITWTAHAGTAGDSGWSSIIYAENRFFATRDGFSGPTDGPIMTSPDGATWTAIDPGYPGPGGSTIFAQNQYVSVQNDGHTVSTDGGMTWSGGTLPGGATTIYDVFFAGDRYIAAGWGGTDRLLTSEDALTWTVETPPVTGMYSGIAYGNGRFVVTAMDGELITSECAGGAAAEEEADSLITPHPLDDGMIAHWRMDEGTGTTVSDSIGDYDGTFVNTPRWATRGPVGNSSLTFHREDEDGVQIEGLLGQPENGTIAMWVNVASYDTFGATFLNIGNSIVLGDGGPEDGGVVLSYRNASTWEDIQSNISLSGLGWHYVIGTWDQTEDLYRIYIDGILVQQVEEPAPIEWDQQPNTFIGRNANGSNEFDMQGGIDDVRVYNRALSPLEAQQLYERVHGSSEVRNSTPPATLQTDQGQLSASRRGLHACAIKQDGSTWCWGSNGNGQLGINSSVTDVDVPYKVQQQSIHDFKQISAGRFHTCGIAADNTAWCWGDDTTGQRGDGAALGGLAQVPTQVAGGALWKQISAGYAHTCGIQLNGTLWCWGGDTTQQLGNGAGTTQQDSPVAIGTALYSQVDAGEAHTCAIRTDGTAWCWGRGLEGQIGDNNTITRNTPTAVRTSVQWKDISAQTYASCGISTDGSLYCWGDGGYRQPFRLVSSGSWQDVEIGSNHLCALKVDGSLWCWGNDSNGQLGNGPTITASQTFPARVAIPGPVTAYAVGNEQTCAMEANNALWCWGLDSTGSLGNGAATADQHFQDRVVGFPNISPWLWNAAADAFQLNGNFRIALGDKWISDDGSARYFGFESAGKARLRQAGSSNQLLVETAAANTSAQVSFKKGPVTGIPLDYTTGRVAEWLFNDASGSSTATASVGGLNGTVSGTTSFNTTGDRVSTNGVLEFDGAGRVNVANNVLLRPTSFTVSFWMRANNLQASGATVLSKAHTNNTGTQEQTYGFEFGPSGQLLFATGITGAQDFLPSALPVRQNSWVHVVGVYDPAGAAPQKRLYINGVLSGSKTQTTALVYDTTAAGDLFFGAAGCTGICQGFSGGIDDVRIYNTALTTAQVAQIYAFQNDTVAPQAIGIDHGTNNLEIARQNPAATDWLSTLSPDLALTSTGTVGLGTATPAVTVDVSGGARVGFEAACTAAGEGAIRYTGNLSDSNAVSCPASSWTLRNASSAGIWSDVTYGAGLFAAVAQFNGTNGVMTSPDGITWTNRTTPNQNWNAIAYGNNLFVAVTYDATNTIITSADGITWTTATVPASGWESVQFLNGRFFAVRGGVSDGAVMSSTDGVTWTLGSLPSAQNWQQITYGNGLYLVTSTLSITAYSTDGINWTQGTTGGTNPVRGLTFGNGVFVAARNGTTMSYSTDGINWATTTASTLGEIGYIDFSNGQFVAISNSAGTRHVGVSRDGINWTTYAAPQLNWWRGITYGNGRYVAVSEDGVNRVMTSDCSISADASLPPGAVGYWKFDETAGTNAADSAGANAGTLNGNAAFVTGRKGNAVSLDGVGDFVTMASPAALDDLTSSTYCAWVNLAATQPQASGHIVGKTTDAGANGMALYSATNSGANRHFTVRGRSTNLTVTRSSAIPGNVWTHVCGTWNGSQSLAGTKIYVNGTEVSYTSSAGPGATTSDAANNLTVGKQGSAAGGSDLRGLVDEVIIYNRVLSRAEIEQVMAATGSNPQSYGGGPNGVCGETWTTEQAMTDMAVVQLAYGNGMFVAAGGWPSYLGSSPDGITWTARTLPGTASFLNSVTYAHGLFVAVSGGAATHQVITSPDGINWTGRTAGAASAWVDVAYGDGIFMAVSQNATNNIMTSPDGITWTAQNAPVQNWENVVYGNGRWVVTGLNQTMTSTDGLTWTAQGATYAPWNDAVYGEGVFVGGTNAEAVYSVDGLNWSNVALSGGIGALTYTSTGHFVGVSWNGTHTAVSPDGINWTRYAGAISNRQWSGIAEGGGKVVIASSLGGGGGWAQTSTCSAADRFQYCNGTRWNDFGPASNLQWKRTPNNMTAGGNWMGGLGAACGVLSSGEARCWGPASDGEIGDGRTSPDAPYPVTVQTTTGPGNWSDWVQMSASHQFTCGIRAGGTAWCWGNGPGGELGNGTYGSSTRPVQVQTDTGPGGWSDWTSITTGNEFACGLRANGQAWCWGVGWYGSLGNNASNGGTVNRPVMVDTDVAAPGWSDWVQISAGMVHTCGIRANGTLWCWGENRYGALGNNVVPGSEWGNVSPRPVQVVNDVGGAGWSDWVQIDTSEVSCGRRSNGTVWCWGLARGGTDVWGADTARPYQVRNNSGGAGWTDWVHITTGGQVGGCGIRANGAAWCWGYNTLGNFGDGTTNSSSNPVQVLNDTGGAGWTDWVGLDATQARTTCGVRADGSGWCWGENSNYQVGNGTSNDQMLPTRVLPAP